MTGRLFRWFSGVLVVLAAVSGCTTGAPGTGPPIMAEQAVREVYLHYNQALARRDGPAVAGLLSASTLAEHRQLAVLAGTGGPREIGTRPVGVRYQVAVLRARLAPARIARLSGRELVVHNVGRNRGSDVPRIDIRVGEIRVGGDRAVATVLFGKDGSFEAELVRDNGFWRVVQRPLSGAPDDDPVAGIVARLVRESGMPEDEVIFSLVRSLTGKEVTAAIFDRP